MARTDSRSYSALQGCRSRHHFTATDRGQYVFFFISHDRRELIHFNVTASPTAAWIWQQLLEATPWGRQPAHLIHDRDAVYGRDFDRHAAQLGDRGLSLGGG